MNIKNNRSRSTLRKTTTEVYFWQWRSQNQWRLRKYLKM